MRNFIRTSSKQLTECPQSDFLSVFLNPGMSDFLAYNLISIPDVHQEKDDRKVFYGTQAIEK